MQSLSDDERKDVMGEILHDELKAILEYVKDLPALKQEIHQVRAVVEDLSEKFTVFDHVVREHEKDIRQLKRKSA